MIGRCMPLQYQPIYTIDHLNTYQNHKNALTYTTNQYLNNLHQLNLVGVSPSLYSRFYYSGTDFPSVRYLSHYTAHFLTLEQNIREHLVDLKNFQFFLVAVHFFLAFDWVNQKLYTWSRDLILYKNVGYLKLFILVQYVHVRI